MKHLFAPYSLAVLAKEKGFQESCLAYYKHGSSHLYPFAETQQEELYSCLSDHLNEHVYLQIGSNIRHIPEFKEVDNGLPWDTFRNLNASPNRFAAPLYQQLVDFVRGKGIWVCENKPSTKERWRVYAAPTIYFNYLTLDEALKSALEVVITPYKNSESL